MIPKKKETAHWKFLNYTNIWYNMYLYIFMQNNHIIYINRDKEPNKVNATTLDDKWQNLLCTFLPILVLHNKQIWCFTPHTVYEKSYEKKRPWPSSIDRLERAWLKQKTPPGKKIRSIWLALQIFPGSMESTFRTGPFELLSWVTCGNV